MALNKCCSFCGRYRGPRDDPHPNHDCCPFRSNHEEYASDATLLESIRATRAGHSICLFGWSGKASYPVFRTVHETRSWLTITDMSSGKYEGHEKYDTSHFRKTIRVTGNLYDLETSIRIEYDPTTESLLDWYSVSEDSEKRGGGAFKAYIRKDASDVSYFGASLDD